MKIRAQFFSMRFGHTDIEVLRSLLKRAPEHGLNMVCLEVEKAFQYQSHPKVSAPWALPKNDFEDLVRLAQESNVELVPLLPAFSHSEYVLEHYGEFKEGDSRKICCPSNPDYNAFVCDLMDELIEVFRPRYFHIGHDEAISSFDVRSRSSIYTCPTCKDHQPHELFANSVKTYHGFLKERGIRTMMWADQLLDPDDYKDVCFAQSGVYGGAPDYHCRAIDLLPRDIILCDWHYEIGHEFPTTRYLQDKGFETLGCPRYPLNAFLFARDAWKNRTSKFLGMMATSWMAIDKERSRFLHSIVEGNGFVFCNPGTCPNDPLYQRLVKTIQQKQDPLPAGDFRKIFVFEPDGAGIQHSLGWTDLGIMDTPNDPYLKKGRMGTIAYAFKTRAGYHFEKAALKLWFNAPGPSELRLQVDGQEEEQTIDITKQWRGGRLDLTRYVQGADAFRIRFAVTNNTHIAHKLFKRFELVGKTTR